MLFIAFFVSFLVPLSKEMIFLFFFRYVTALLGVFARNSSYYERGLALEGRRLFSDVSAILLGT
jgi:hypothetical protein